MTNIPSLRADFDKSAWQSIYDKNLSYLIVSEVSQSVADLENL
ncbi:hypothetical protein [Helicobacter sp. T3_23-1059]